MEQVADHADDQSAEECGDKSIDGEANPKLASNPACQEEEQSIDQQCSQPQGQNDHRTTYQGEDWAQDGVDQAKDQRQPYERKPVRTLWRDAVPIHQGNRRIQCHCINYQVNQKSFHFFPCYHLQHKQINLSFLTHFSEGSVKLQII
jgi:hypothetical protein